MVTWTPRRDAARPRRGVGSSAGRPDGILKVRGEFAYSSDLSADGMLWGATLRSPHPSARIRSIDIAAAEAHPGVHAVLTHEDVPGCRTYGLKRPDQPVLAWDTVRYEGEPVALIAADHPKVAREASSKIVVEYDVLDPLTDAELAICGTAPSLHPGGNVLRHVHIEHGDIEADEQRADVVVQGEYQIGMQDQAFLGPESGLAIPGTDGGVDVYVASQWLHDDRHQIAGCLALPEEMVRVWLAGVGGAFGGREDLSMQLHACLLALRTGRPIKMVYDREESFFGHVHRHPAWLRYEHGATKDGQLVYVKARIVLDGGAYASKSEAVCVTAATTAAGPYTVPNAVIDAYATYTNNPPCGAMRGFGAVQTCFAYESQMDKLATALGMDPVEVRRRNAMQSGTITPTGQAVDGPAPVAELLDRLEAMALPTDQAVGSVAPCWLPGGFSNATRGEGVVRGVGYAVGFKNICFSAGTEDSSTARVRLYVSHDQPVAVIETAACEVGQGVVAVQEQIARTELGVDETIVLPADTAMPSAGCSAASRQTWVTGGAVKAACEAVREIVLERARERLGAGDGDLALRDGHVVTASGAAIIGMAELLGDEVVEATREFRPPVTEPLDEQGQGNVHVAFGFAAHRAVVDVDVDLGLVRVIEMATAQDVGKAINPLAVEGQMEGGIAQGVGLALMEEIQVADGRIRNPSFTDYLIPTTLDMPRVECIILEHPQPHSPYGLNGVGEPPTISSTPAVVAAMRAATGKALNRVPLSPDQLIEGIASGVVMTQSSF